MGIKILCDQNIKQDIVKMLKEGPGRLKVATAYEKHWHTLDDPHLVRAASKGKWIILTEDNGLSSSQTYPICTHAGILVIHAPNHPTRERAALLQRFLHSGNRDRCKHAIVTLTADYTIIEDGNGVKRIQA